MYKQYLLGGLKYVNNAYFGLFGSPENSNTISSDKLQKRNAIKQVIQVFPMLRRQNPTGTPDFMTEGFKFINHNYGFGQVPSL